MRVLVTGASGHVGGAIAAHLVQCGHDVVGLSRRTSGVAGLCQQIEIDLGAPAFVEQVIDATPACDAIIHAAAALDKEPDAPAISLTNCLGTQHILAVAHQWNTQSFVYISGVPVIGMPEIIPIAEDHPVHPLTAYHASKVYGEYLLDVARRAGLAGASLRLTSPVGPGMPANRIFSVFVARARANQPLQLAGAGTRRQNYVDVRDVAIAAEQCARERVTGLFNIAGAQSISNHELAQACVRIIGSSSPIVFTGQPDREEGIAWEISNARAAERFGYAPRYDVAASIRAVGEDDAA
ncbi:MAG: NAD(P)-dependent oxidoreductase, partial [Chloroflexota bacterium]|nr:NAD(P)-dependent oxidoreductase [Chloroflexota bacterium]